MVTIGIAAPRYPGECCANEPLCVACKGTEMLRKGAGYVARSARRPAKRAKTAGKTKVNVSMPSTCGDGHFGRVWPVGKAYPPAYSRVRSGVPSETGKGRPSGDR